MWMAKKESALGAGTGEAVGHGWGIEKHKPTHTHALQKNPKISGKQDWQVETARET